MLGRFVPTMQRIVNVAARNWNGEPVPIEDKVFSLFESHSTLPCILLSEFHQEQFSKKR